MMDADSGEILLAAGAGGPEVTPGNWREARDFDRANPARSALRLPAWQHDGGAHSSPGSAFKIVSALGLEMAARHDPVLDAMLGGLPLPALDQLARQRGFAFRSDAAAYPYDTRAAHITNYREQSLVRRAESGRLGLVQSMTYSVNTWFAWAAELSDRTLQGQPEGGAPGLRALEPAALDAQRPLAAAASALGFGTAMRLDGGLLPAGFPWQRYDALQSSAARIDPIDSRHELRQMAIGLRMQATPLQMAVAAAAIASGKAPVPRLLLALGARESVAAAQDALPVRLDRIRQGMKGVVDAGTAAGAFGGPELAGIRRGLYGKTGTAPVSEDDATVWFAGWLEPGSLPGQRRRLAFAAFVSHSKLTGGGHAAPIVAALLKAMSAQSGEQKGNFPSIAANGWAAPVTR
jgi:cell division protein FtsI/penicillin-binding protein 2